MEYLEAGRLVYRQSRRYLSNVLPLVQEALVSTVSLFHLYLRLLLHLLRPVISLLLNLYSLLSPLLSSLLSRLWLFFLRQPARALAIEAAVAITILLLIAFERRFQVFARIVGVATHLSKSVRYKYRSFVEGVRQQSRFAAASLPHLLFIAGAFLFHRAAGPAVHSLAAGATGLFLTVARPVWLTVKLLYAVDVEHIAPGHFDEDDDEVIDSPDTANERLQTPRERAAGVRRRKSTTPLSEPYRTRARVRMEREMERERENDAADANAGTTRSSLLRFISSDNDDKPDDASHRREPRTPPRRRRTASLEADENAIRDSGEIAVLKFWIVFGLAWAVRSVVWYFVPAMLGGVIGKLDVALLYVLVWAQVGLTRGANLVYGLIAGVARRRWKRSGTDRTQTANIFVRLAVAANLVRTERVADLTSAVAESGLALTGVVFLITPRVATYLGTLLIGLLVPVYLTTSALEGGATSSAARQNWLAYWAVIAVVEVGFLACADLFGWLPLWYHVKMVGILWMQLPYYRGAGVILEAIMGYVGSMLSTVRREVVTPRKRKRA